MVGNDDLAEEEVVEVVAFARRGSRNRVGKSGGIVKKKTPDDLREQEHKQKLDYRPAKRKQVNNNDTQIEFGNEDEIIEIEADIPSKKPKNEPKVRRGKEQSLLHETNSKSIKSARRCSPRVTQDCEPEKECLLEAGNTGGQLIPSPPVNARKQQNELTKNLENPYHRICRWLTKSLSHPLSMEATHAALRPVSQEVIGFIQENVRTTIEQSFNNSVMVVGAPGTGKSTIVSRVCNLVDKEWNTVQSDPKVGIVRLSGLAFSDERSAFKEIAKQLCATLRLEYLRNASYGENIKFLLSILKALYDANKAALFILEDFDLFAQTQKQTFLYCLLDSLQKSNAKAVVIGTTCRHDCLDLLEKRVRSRFSHRTVTLMPPIKTADEGNGALDILESMLTLPVGVFPDGSIAEDHNKKVALACRDNLVESLVSKLVESTNSLHTLSHIAKRSLLLSCTQREFSVKNLVDAMRSHMSQASRGFEGNISNLCPLDLAVLAAAHEVRTIRVDGVLNFEMIHHEFRSYFSMGNHVDNYSKVAAMKSFEHLVSEGILCCTRETFGPLRRRDRYFNQVSLQITREELLQGFERHPNADMRLRDWCQKDGGPMTTALLDMADI